MNPSTFLVTDKFQAFTYRFFLGLIAFGMASNVNLANPDVWQTETPRALSIIGASFFLAVVDYVQNMRAPVGTNPTHDGNS